MEIYINLSLLFVLLLAYGILLAFEKKIKDMMKAKTSTILFLFILYVISANAQLTQTIKGNVVDKQTQMPLPGATIMVQNTDPILGTTTDVDGRFRLNDVLVGRQSMKISFVGYHDVFVNNLVVSSGKEVVLYIELDEKVEKLNEVIIIGQAEKERPINKMATVSARMFTVEETEKFAGSRGDVARMAMNYAGVSGANDSRNDIVIRGNSPSGLLWKLEGIDIGNPNHFAQQGTTGGPVGMLNNNNLRNSDFFTGAFPAEYGNAMSGVFDLKLKTGNTDKYEFLGQVGFNGFEVGIEGPISRKNRSSFLANYRYSTLAVMNKLGMEVGTGTGVPYYQDLTYNVVIPLKKGKLQFFGLAGTSHIAMLSDTAGPENIYSPMDQNLYNGSDLVFSGVKYSRTYSDKAFLTHSLSYLYEGGWTRIDSLDFDYNPTEVFKEESASEKLSYRSDMSYKFNSRISFKTGATIDRMGFNLNSVYFDPEINGYRDITNTKKGLDNGVWMSRVYNQWLYKFNDRLQVTPGVQVIYFDQNKQVSVEPRIGLQWQVTERSRFNLGYGLHSRIQNLSIIFMETRLVDGSYIKSNTDLGFTKGHHFVASYDLKISDNTRLKSEVYYQYLFDVPVTSYPSTFSMLNTGASWGEAAVDSLVNEGLGRNYGLELTLERFYSKGLYYLVTASLFESRYTASDGIERTSAFNGNFVLNALLGKEFSISKKSSFFVDLKATWAGGRRYTPIDIERSKLEAFNAFTAVYKNDEAFSLKFPDYLKADVKLGYRLNGKSITQEWILYVENVTNKKNVLMQVWDPQNKEIDTKYQLGIFPMMQYRLLF